MPLGSPGAPSARRRSAVGGGRAPPPGPAIGQEVGRRSHPWLLTCAKMLVRDRRRHATVPSNTCMALSRSRVRMVVTRLGTIRQISGQQAGRAKPQVARAPLRSLWLRVGPTFLVGRLLGVLWCPNLSVSVRTMMGRARAIHLRVGVLPHVFLIGCRREPATVGGGGCRVG